MDRNSLSDSIPPHLIEEIKLNGEENDSQKVYRVSKCGKINEIAFMNSFEECQYENRENKDNLNEIGSYSTSCYTTPKYPLKFISNLKKKYFDKFPYPVIICGNTICGLSQLTIKRKPKYRNKEHIDWWIYKDGLDKIVKNFEKFE